MILGIKRLCAEIFGTFLRGAHCRFGLSARRESRA